MLTPWDNPDSNVGLPARYAADGTQIRPTTIQAVNLWSQYVISRNGTYRAALKRVVSYFVTEVSVGDSETGKDEKDKASKFLNDVLHIRRVLFRVGFNYLTYGNVFLSVVLPFRRYLVCPKCASAHPLSKIYSVDAYQFHWQSFEFHAVCQGKKDGKPCQYRGAWDRDDRRSNQDDDVRIKIWPPNEIEIDHEELSDNRKYCWKIPEYYRRKIREGRLHHLERVPWEVVEAIRDNMDLEFAQDSIYHFYEDTLAGHMTGGWGMSPVLANFDQASYVQTLINANRSIARTSVNPLRILSPTPTRGGGGAGELDPIFNVSLGGFMAQARSIIRRHQLDPDAWYTLAYPLQAQVIGGDAKNFAPTEMLDQGISQFLNDVGVPAEFYRGTMAAETAKLTLRVFEGIWRPLVDGLNGCIQWVYDRVAADRVWEPLYVRLTAPSVIDDMQDQMAKLQLMTSKVISETDGLKPLGLDRDEQKRKILEEERFDQEMTARLQKEMDQAAGMEQISTQAQQPQQPDQGGQGGPGGQASAAASGMQTATPNTPNAPKTPAEMMQQAEIKADEMLQMSDSQRFSALRQLEEADSAMHGLVKEMLAKKRRAAQSQGGQQVLQQQYGAGKG